MSSLTTTTWRILFKNRKHIDITDATSSDAATKAIAQCPKHWVVVKYGNEIWTIVDPPLAKRNCPSCGMFMAKDEVNRTCRECKTSHAWMHEVNREEKQEEIRRLFR